MLLCCSDLLDWKICMISCTSLLLFFCCICRRIGGGVEMGGQQTLDDYVEVVLLHAVDQQTQDGWVEAICHRVCASVASTVAPSSMIRFADTQVWSMRCVIRWTIIGGPCLPVLHGWDYRNLAACRMVNAGVAACSTFPGLLPSGAWVPGSPYDLREPGRCRVD